MKQEALVFELLESGGACSHDVADEIGKTPKIASAVLSSLYAAGLLDRKGIFHERISKNKKHPGIEYECKRVCFMYWRKDIGF